jgi:hypothetical protein
MMNSTDVFTEVCNTTICCQQVHGGLSFHIEDATACFCVFPRFPACNGSLAQIVEGQTAITSIQVVLAFLHIALLVFVAVVTASRLVNVGATRFSVANLSLIFCIFASIGKWKHQ